MLEYLRRKNLSTRWWKLYLAVLLLLVLGLVAFHGLTSKNEKILVLQEKSLKEFQFLHREYSKIKEKERAISEAVKKRPIDFNLSTFADKKAKEAGIKGNVKNMKSEKSTLGNEWAMIKTQVGLEGVTLGQIVSFISHIDNAEELVRVTDVSIHPSQMRVRDADMAQEMTNVTDVSIHPSQMRANYLDATIKLLTVVRER
ncbi:MAG TPA: hypothetical protein PLG80_02465 [Syntrophales bacterium]|nr:hypothetical protein [Syntrophales bacterium]HPO34895.1 hypothetical protein [Syntrophales bacterium]